MTDARVNAISGWEGGQMNRLEVEVIFTPDLRQRFLPCRCVNNKEKDWHYIRDAQVEFKIVRSHKFFLIPYIYISPKIRFLV